MELASTSKLTRFASILTMLLIPKINLILLYKGKQDSYKTTIASRYQNGFPNKLAEGFRAKFCFKILTIWTVFFQSLSISFTPPYVIPTDYLLGHADLLNNRVININLLGK